MKIENVVEELLIKHNLKQIPVDVATLANRIGLAIEYVEMKDPLITGFIDEFKLYVRSDMSTIDKLYYISLMIGDYILHREYVDDDSRYIAETTLGRVDKKYLECKRFASLLQIPREELSKYYTMTTLDKLKTIFLVNETRLLEAIRELP